MSLKGKGLVSCSLAALVFLALTIVLGRILDLINKSSCRVKSSATSSSPPGTLDTINGAHTWTSWALGISVLGLIISLVGIGLIAYTKTTGLATVADITKLW